MTELAFCDSVARFLKITRLPDGSGSFSFVASSEFPFPGAGIADLVIVKKSSIRKLDYNKDLLHHVAASRDFAAYILNRDKHWSRDADITARMLHITVATARRYIRFCDVLPSKSLSAHVAMLRHVDLISIEVKMHDWKRAFRQASKHRLYATRSVVLMPTAHADPAIKHLKVIRGLGIGLWSYDPQAGLLSLHSAPRRKPPIVTGSCIQSAARFLLRYLRSKPTVRA
jgi:hypothetical protein